VLLVDSYGLIALALDRESAAAALGLKAGSGVTLVPEGTGTSTATDSVTTNVDLIDKGDR
jgi:hypothetical protein